MTTDTDMGPGQAAPAWSTVDLNCLSIVMIPARGGSKGVPCKNIVKVASKPLIAWTIEAALASPVLDRIIVSTDEPEIADVACRYGAEVPFLRPPELAQDHTPGIEPILHAVRWLDEHEGYRPDYVMVLQPTSPLRTAEDIQTAVQLAQERQAEGVVSVCPAHQHPYSMKQITEDGRLTNFLPMDRPYYPCFIIPEAGVNHNGDVGLAKRLVDVATRAGADAVKFQTFKAEQVVSATTPKAEYQLQITDVAESQLQVMFRADNHL